MLPSSASGAIGASLRVFPPHPNNTVLQEDSTQPQSSRDRFPAMEQRRLPLMQKWQLEKAPLQQPGK